MAEGPSSGAQPVLPPGTPFTSSGSPVYLFVVETAADSSRPQGKLGPGFAVRVQGTRLMQPRSLFGLSRHLLLGTNVSKQLVLCTSPSREDICEGFFRSQTWINRERLNAGFGKGMARSPAKRKKPCRQEPVAAAGWQRPGATGEAVP